ncbi:MAG: phosphoribosylaminoimidazolesuccinocarboxamide synthase [Sedimentisphaerales bacterium]|nr:phosphoribosylaminoimidazolesuccinocarboxamide synthase [Sedimentisphaerales bacterium]
MSNQAVLQTKVAGHEPIRGKVRDIYDLGDKLLLVASDRISAFDVIMANGIPDKGALLTQISAFWFEWLGDAVKNHVITTKVAELPEPFCDMPEQFDRRSMLVKKTKVMPVECVVRGYLAGSGWKEYQQSQTVCGHKLPAGIQQCGKLPEPIFTPATKAELGEHDENIDFDRAAKILGTDAANYVREKSIDIYRRAAEYAAQRGIILADTKFEWGYDGDDIILIDEILTPDSSRFWPADKYQPGRDQESYDKQFVRNYLESINFNKQPPGVELPENVVNGTRQRYVEAYEKLSGRKF